MRTLITNDDGIGSAGLLALARAAVEHGLDVVVAAPRYDASGAGAGVVAVLEDGAVASERRTLDGLPGVEAHAVAAQPAFIVLAAANGAFGDPPELVLSGINLGANTGRAVLHSGTVGAALTGALHGARGLAVSLDVALDPPDRPRWASAAAVVRTVLPLVVDAPVGTAVNLNVPDRPVAALGELRRATLARVGQVRGRVVLEDSRLRTTWEAVSGDPEPGTDTAALAEGHCALTALAPVREADAGLPGRLPLDPPAGTAAAR